ncbi:hypothetical protein [Paractinoplanes atraurantiacus]|uniref:hypothetical protein n=1 Tax=Paractinoplanes atraurantiacus TaxID=1036182 RepID=UPI0011782EB4|nr:hypothetical protein [Actinoplanes atraurantiacus]
MEHVALVTNLRESLTSGLAAIFDTHSDISALRGSLARETKIDRGLTAILATAKPETSLDEHVVALRGAAPRQRLELRKGDVAYAVRNACQMLVTLTEVLDFVPIGRSAPANPLDLLPDILTQQQSRIADATASLAAASGEPRRLTAFTKSLLEALRSRTPPEQNLEDAVDVRIRAYEERPGRETPEEPFTLRSSSRFSQSIVAGAGGGGVNFTKKTRLPEDHLRRASELVQAVADEVGDVCDELHSSPARAPRELRERCHVAASQLSGTLEKLWEALSDFQGADLSGVTIGLDHLDGVRWSDGTAPAGATAWPSALRKQVERHSAAVDGMPGAFEVRFGVPLPAGR